MAYAQCAAKCATAESKERMSKARADFRMPLLNRRAHLDNLNTQLGPGSFCASLCTSYLHLFLSRFLSFSFPFSLPLSVEVFNLLASLFGWLSVAVTGHSSAQTLLVLETEEGETKGAYQLKQLKNTQPAHVAVRREREREKGCAQTAQLTPLEMRLDVQLSETCEPLKCRYFRLPQGVTYAKGATATTTKTKCTCHTTTTHACTLPSFMPQLSKVSTYVCVNVCVSVCVLLVFAKHFAGIHLPVGQL